MTQLTQTVSSPIVSVPVTKSAILSMLSQLPYDVQVGLVTGLGMRLMLADSAEDTQTNG